MATHTRPALGDLATATPAGRNRAIDLYRVVAMVFVAVGHWLVIAIAIGTAAWWVEKLPVLALSLVVLVPIVALVARVERRALLAERTTWSGATPMAIGLALGMSISIKLWSARSVPAVVAGACGVMVVSALVGRPTLAAPLGWTSDRVDASARTAA